MSTSPFVKSVASSHHALLLNHEESTMKSFVISTYYDKLHSNWCCCVCQNCHNHIEKKHESHFSYVSILESGTSLKPLCNLAVSTHACCVCDRCHSCIIYLFGNCFQNYNSYADSTDSICIAISAYSMWSIWIETHCQARDNPYPCLLL